MRRPPAAGPRRGAPRVRAGGQGVFGPNTRKAVLDYQGQHRLPADGNVGAETADLLASLPEGPPLPRPAATGDRVVTSPDVKLVRFLQIGTRDCIRELLPVVLLPQASNVPLACGLLDASSNPYPPASLEGSAWKKFVDSEEFRGFSHIPPMQLTCHDGRVGAVDRQPGDTPFGVSQGWTFMTRHGKRIAEHAEWYGEDPRFHPEREDVQTLSDGSGVVISARQASRIAAVARSAQFDMIGYAATTRRSSGRRHTSCCGATGRRRSSTAAPPSRGVGSS
nr:peptidoglycan-binding domain-containing protein [Actinomycetospora corticicola]